MKILQSASKVVLLLFALALIAGLFLQKITGEQFMIIASSVFTYYFTKRESKTESSI